MVNSSKALYEGFLEREKEFSTGLENGFAIPHSKISAIKKPHVFLLKMKNGCAIKDYETFDKSDVEVIFALLIPSNNDEDAKEHIKIMSLISKKMLDDDFKNAIKTTNDKAKLLKIMSDTLAEKSEAPKTRTQKANNNAKKLNIIGITSCPAGVAHTYLAEESLIKSGQSLGHNVRVETQGTVGAENVLTEAEINQADLLIVAADVKIDLSRFIGKRIYQTTVKEPVKDGIKVIETAIEKATVYNGEMGSSSSESGSKSNKKKFKSEKKRLFFPHIMTGISWMIPIAICSAILLAVPNLAALFTGTTEILSQNWEWSKFKEALINAGKYNDAYMGLFIMNQFAYAVLALMIPVFAAFTAYSIADRPGFAPGLIGGFFATPTKFFLKHLNMDNPWTENVNGIFVYKHVYPFLNLDSGFWGAIVIGLASGYFVLFLNKYIKLNKTFQAMKPMLILPGLGVLFSFVSMVFVINPIFGLMNYHMAEGIKNMTINGQGKLMDYLIAPIVGGLTGFDLGGPINKGIGTVVTAIGPIGENIVPTSLAMRCIAIVAAPMAIGLASTLDRYICGRRVFHITVRKGGVNAIALSFLGISEGGLPALMANPLLVIPINFICGAIGAIMIAVFGVVQTFPDSAIWGWPFPQLGTTGAQGSGVLLYLLALVIAIVSGTLLHIFVRYGLMSLGYIEKPEDFYTGKVSFSRTQWAIRSLKIKAYFLAWTLYSKKEELSSTFVEEEKAKQKEFSTSFAESYEKQKAKFEAKIEKLEKAKADKLALLNNKLNEATDDKQKNKINKKINSTTINFNEKIVFLKTEIDVLNNFKDNKHNDYLAFINNYLKSHKVAKNKKIETKNRKIQSKIDNLNLKISSGKIKNNEAKIEAKIKDLQGKIETNNTKLFKVE